jgi:putrescine transport system ATP-binding protein
MIYEDPADSFVASFIGPVNEIPGEMTDTPEGTHLLQSALGNFRVKKSEVSLPREISLLLRPEKMRLLRQRSAVQENLVEGEIVDLSYLGSRTEYSVRTSQLTFKVFEPELERQKKRSLNPGDRVYLTWKSEDAIVLPRSGTNRAR